jgi:hypothetical protein
MVEADAADAPFFEFPNNVFGEESNLSGPADEPAFFRSRRWSNQREHSGAIGRSNRNPPVAGWKIPLEGQGEPKQISVEM